jgi:hypothetical protein
MAGCRESVKGGRDDAVARVHDPVRQYLCRAGSAHNSVEAVWIAAAIVVASIGPSQSANAMIVRCHCYCAGPNVMRIVSSRSNNMARGNFMRSRPR